MVELHRRDVLEPVADERMQLRVASRDEAPVHQGKGVVGEAGIEPGDKPAGADGQCDERDERFGGAPPAPGCPLSPEGWGEGADSRTVAGTHLTLPRLRRGPLP